MLGRNSNKRRNWRQRLCTRKCRQWWEIRNLNLQRLERARSRKRCSNARSGKRFNNFRREEGQRLQLALLLVLALIFILLLALSLSPTGLVFLHATDVFGVVLLFAVLVVLLVTVNLAQQSAVEERIVVQLLQCARNLNNNIKQQYQ